MLFVSFNHEENDMEYQRVTRHERLLMNVWSQRQGFSMRRMADLLGRDVSTVSRELRRNRGGRGYQFKQADRLAQARAARPGRRTFTPGMEEEIAVRLAGGQTPEAIHGRARLEGRPMVSRERIYQHIYAEADQGGGLWRHLPRAHRRRRRRCPRADGRGRGRIPGQRRIDTRPAEVGTRERVGDWEGDLVAGARNTGNLVTLVERRTRFCLIGHVAGKGADAVRDEVVALLRRMPEETRRTLTLDNGMEFAGHRGIEAGAGLDVYFAYPYHAWERGSNEHLNGVIRRTYPKGSPFLALEGEPRICLARSLNDRPMKCLGWHTPKEMMDMFLASLLPGPPGPGAAVGPGGGLAPPGHPCGDGHPPAPRRSTSPPPTGVDACRPAAAQPSLPPATQPEVPKRADSQVLR